MGPKRIRVKRTRPEIKKETKRKLNLIMAHKIQKGQEVSTITETISLIVDSEYEQVLKEQAR